MSEARQADPLLSRLGSLLEAALNRGLALDAVALERVRELEGRRIGIELRGLNRALAVEVKNGRLVVGPLWERPADLNLRASPGSLLAFALRNGDDSPLPPGKVDISGDAELARRVEKLLRGFSPDIEEAFAKTFGDVPGVPIARALHGGFGWLRESVRAFAQNSADYVREESRDVIAAGELNVFLDEVDALRERVDRLAARVSKVDGDSRP